MRNRPKTGKFASRARLFADLDIEIDEITCSSRDLR